MDKGGEEMKEEKGFSGCLDHKGRWMLLPPSARFLCAAAPGGGWKSTSITKPDTSNQVNITGIKRPEIRRESK